MEGLEEAALVDFGQQPRQPLVDLDTQVLDDQAIRQKILYYAIYQDNGNKILRETIGSLRLVQKSWLKTISELFKTNGDPLFKFKLDGNNRLDDGSLVGQTANVLDQFVESVVSPTSSIHDIIPTFSLTLDPSIFRLENHKRLYNCLRSFGAELLELQLAFPMNGGSLPGIFPGNLFLGRLKTLTVYFPDTNLTNMENRDSVIAHDSNATFLLQSILLGATALTEFEAAGNALLSKVPTGFQFLALPSTLTKIRIFIQMDSAQIELLANCDLPNLDELQFYCTPGVQYQNEAFYRIFDNYRLTLRTLQIAGLPYQAPLQNTLSYRFPVMEKLETFETISIHCELDTNQSSTLETCFPKLHKVCLLHQLITSFINWTENTKLSTVKQLGVLLANGDLSNAGCDAYIHNLDELLMQRLHRTFPNITQLKLVTSTTNVRTCGFKYLFTKMTQLVHLAIIVTGSSQDANSVAFWDALLVGVPVGAAAGLQARPDIWENVKIKCEVLPSIVRLKELKFLTLLDMVSLDVYRDPSMRLISDMAFHYALLRMTKLETIRLQGRFKASALMTEALKRRGKTLLYMPPPGAN